MQNTRLNTLIDNTVERSLRWLQNPWRRISLVMISLLLGNFLATAIATTAGQTAQWDIIVAAILIILTEVSNWFVYRQGSRTLNLSNKPRALVTEMVNAVKIGFIYGMYVEAFKIGS